MMFAMMVLAAPEGQTQVKPSALCGGIAQIEAAAQDVPRPFRSLVVMAPTPTRVPDPAGGWKIENRPAASVKPLAGLVDCRFVYNSTVSVACYGTEEVSELDDVQLGLSLRNFADEIAKCLKNDKLVRGEEDFGTGPAVTFAGGPREPFYQISMVPLPKIDGKRRAELLVLAAAERPAESVVKPKAKAKAKKR